jgi:uncharacterized protein YkwD
MYQRFLQEQKKLIGVFFVFALVSAIFYVFHGQKVVVTNTIKEIEGVTNEFLVQTLHTSVEAPPPLKDTEEVSDQDLTLFGVLEGTNQARAEEQLLPLTLNPTLNSIAQKKLKDMFFYQYFEHISPTGVGAGDLAKKNGYDYLVIGENLAMGNFANDASLVDAWMKSPGHRANILNTRYKEIGIAVGQGIYEGRLTWLAVQEFGLPMNDCAVPMTQDKVAIDTEKKSIDTQEKVLNTLKGKIDAAEDKSSPEHMEMIQQYNDLVRTYNADVISLKAKIATYNKQVAAFNVCAQAS